jgi:hypothetical protein
MRGLKVSDYIIPMGINDTYPTNLDIYGKGGIHSVLTLVDRDAITTERRSEGMLAYVSTNQEMYTLIGGTSNDNWQEVYNITNSYNITDIRLDIISLRRDLDRVKPLYKLDYNKIWIGDSESYAVARSQIGISNLPTLGSAKFPYPTGISLPDVPIPNPSFSPLSPLDWIMSSPWLTQIFAGTVSTINTNPETIISSSLGVAQIKIAQVMKRLDNTGFIVSSRTINFEWDNPAMLAIPEAIKTLYGLSPTYTFTAAQALDELQAGLLKQNVRTNPDPNNPNLADGNITNAIAGMDYVDLDIPLDVMDLALIRPLNQDVQGNDISKLLSRVDKLPLNNLTNLSAKAFWQGNGADISRPIEFLFSSLGIGILKVNVEGDLDLAVGGIDYPTIESVALAQTTADAAAAAAAAAPAEGAALAAIYFNAQMLPYSAIPGITVGFSISAALATVTAAAASAQSTANTAVNLINTVKIEGDVIGVNDSNTNIITSTFTPNPVFTGNEAMTIPSGFTSQRPVNAVSGMIRFNKEI